MFHSADLKRSADAPQLSHGDGDQLQLPDIDVKVSKHSMSEDDKHEDDDLLSKSGLFLTFWLTLLYIAP